MLTFITASLLSRIDWSGLINIAGISNIIPLLINASNKKECNYLQI